ncbi:RHS repeat-associated core domain-containing protein [Vibrio navarrensis]|uniref:RHS repeat-associated core domain-containing protein n=1 Tax=Vibrio navarrensis TaxID=29495 RepID=UPI001558386B|nr:RHS repeat-associated core domain-containing protein [Vibrio navarrensis]
MNKQTALTPAELCKDTPTITLLDSRGLTIAEINLLRRNINEPVEALTTQHRYSAAGFLTLSADPRLNHARLHNFTYLNSLSGAPLITNSVDAGTTWQLGDAKGRLWLSGDESAHHQVHYDVLSRPTHREERPLGTTTGHVRERWVYGEGAPEASARNLNGQCIRHYDLGGRNEMLAFNLQGDPLHEQRRLLNSYDDALWVGEHESAWQRALCDETFDTYWQQNALGEQMRLTDAAGNHHDSHYNRLGQQAATYFTPMGHSHPQLVRRYIDYSADGLPLIEQHGNGVTRHYEYHPLTRRLMQMRSERPQQQAMSTLLQDMHYEYDPVGNILTIDDKTVAVKYYKNQRVSGKSQYRYDSLYQLIEAKGRENTNNLLQNHLLPQLSSDPLAHSDYTRQYHYDSAGNLTKMQHQGEHSYTRQLTVSTHSNHSVDASLYPHISAEQVKAKLFDKHGNLCELSPGKTLRWSSEKQLTEATLLKREQYSDTEHYQYSTMGHRLVKRTHRLIMSDVKDMPSASGRVRAKSRLGNVRQSDALWSEQEVIYLPGVEIRRGYQRLGQTITKKEERHVATLDSMRYHLWLLGTPDAIKSNKLYRYQLDNHLSSAHLELNEHAEILSHEEYYPFGGTAVWSAKSQTEAKYKTIRYSGKERDTTGLYYYGYRYYAPWLCRWLNPDPAGTVDGLNLFRMVRNNPVTLSDMDGRAPGDNEKVKPKRKSVVISTPVLSGQHSKDSDNSGENSDTTARNILTISNLIESDSIIQSFINEPSEKCEAAASHVSQILRKNEITHQVRGMYMWAKANDDMPMNHFVTVASIGGDRIVIDPTIAQFSASSPSRVSTEHDWSVDFSNLNTTKAIGYRDFPSSQQAKSRFSTATSVEPFGQDDLTFINKPSWYDRGERNVAALKTLREKEVAARRAAIQRRKELLTSPKTTKSSSCSVL